jgi:thioesterase domain-containing protein
MTPEQLTAYLQSQIPLTAQAGVTAQVCTPERVVLHAPLERNRNPHHTAFGGSLALMGVLGGWSLLHVALLAEGLDTKLVVQKTDCEFLQPLTDDLIAETLRPMDDHWTRFLATLRRYRRGRIEVQTTLHAFGTEAVIHRGIYAAALS